MLVLAQVGFESLVLAGKFKARIFEGEKNRSLITQLLVSVLFAVAFRSTWYATVSYTSNALF